MCVEPTSSTCVLAACERAREAESQRELAEQEWARQEEMELERDRAAADYQRIREAKRQQTLAYAKRRNQEARDRQVGEQRQRVYIHLFIYNTYKYIYVLIMS